MSFESLKNATMDISREGTLAKNDIGETVGTWAVVASGVSVRFQEMGGEERTDQSVAVVRRGKIWFDLGLDLTESDRVVIDGASWEVKLVEADVAGAGHHGAAEIQAVD